MNPRILGKNPHGSVQRQSVSTLFDLFKMRIDMTPRDVAYSYFEQKSQAWRDICWIDIYQQFTKARNALAAENLQTGDRILLTLPNGIEWIAIEQAAHYLGLVIVALPIEKSAAHINHVINDSEPRIVFIASDIDHETIKSHITSHNHKTKIISLDERESNLETVYFHRWINQNHPFCEKKKNVDKNALATIIYTSGTTGEPKGVMHTHRSLLNNSFACFERITLSRHDKLLSTTSAAHIIERVAGYYVPMIGGASVCFSTNSNNTLKDLQHTQASVVVTTPHVLDELFNEILAQHVAFRKTITQFMNFKNGVDRYRMKFIFWPLIEKMLSRKLKKQLTKKVKKIFCGGASISHDTLFISEILGIPVYQGYGLSESGIVCVNSPEKQKQGSVGKPLNNTTITLSAENEIIIESDSLMSGYWKNKTLTRQILNEEKLHTADLARFEDSFIYLTGRKSELIHLSNGTKISPLPIENKISADRLFKNASIFGENREKLTVICQICPENWADFLSKNNETENLSDKRKHSLLSVRINTLIKTLPDHHFIDFIIPTFDEWNTENALICTLGKVRKNNIEEYYAEKLRSVYR